MSPRHPFFCALFLVATLGAPGGEAPAPRDPAIAAIVQEISEAKIEASVRQLVSFKTRHTFSTTTHPDQGIGAARQWIKSEFERYARDSGGRLKVEFDSFRQPPRPPRAPQGGEIVNVVATLPGTQPAAQTRVFVVSGHYDSRALAAGDVESFAPGANDDASGTAAVMELARVMSKYAFESTLVFMAVAGEEQGLLGAAHWAKTARANGLKVAGMFTNDIIGNTLKEDGTRERSHVRVFAEGVPVPVAPSRELSAETLAQLATGGENDFPTRQLARLIQSVGARYVPQLPVKVIYRRDRFGRGGDHAPFLAEGFPAVRFTEAYEVFARQHQDVRVENGVQYGDLPEFVDFAYVADVARVNAAALAELANAPGGPQGVELELTKDNDTIIRWTPNAEPDLAGYRIVWRETTAWQWQHELVVPKTATRHKVPGFSKDNFIFGVQALDGAGHASPATYPKPQRVN